MQLEILLENLLDQVLILVFGRFSFIWIILKKFKYWINRYIHKIIIRRQYLTTYSFESFIKIKPNVIYTNFRKRISLVKQHFHNVFLKFKNILIFMNFIFTFIRWKIYFIKIRNKNTVNWVKDHLSYQLYSFFLS